MMPQYLSAWDKTPVTVTITNGIGENGDPLVVATYNGLCDYIEKSKYRFGKDGERMRINGVLKIGEDIAPGIAVLEGYVQINGVTSKILRGIRERNFHGVVELTKLELI